MAAAGRVNARHPGYVVDSQDGKNRLWGLA